MTNFVKLGSICDLMTGGTPSRSHEEFFGGDIRWLVSGDIHKGEIYDCEGRITEDGLKSSNTRILPMNSIMIALNGQGKTRATVAMLRTKATCNQSLVSIYPKDDAKVLPEWIYLNLKGRYDELRKLTGDSGGERRGLNMMIIRNIDIPEPPSIEKQKEIVKKLDANFKKIDQIIESMRDNLSLSNNLRAELIDSYMGESGSTALELGSFCKFENGDRGKNYPSKSKQIATGIPFINAGNLNRSIIDFNAMAYISQDTFNNLGGGKIKKNDILFCLRGSLGKFATVSDLKVGAIASSLVIIRPDTERALVDYLLYYFEGEQCKRMIRKFENGAAQPNLSAGSLKKFVISLPDVVKQSEVVQLLNQAIERVDSTIRLRKKKIEYLLMFKQSMLNEVFSESDVK